MKKSILLLVVLAFTLVMTAQKKERNVLFETAVPIGSFEERLESLQIVSAHPKPEKFNWDLGNETDNAKVMHVVLLDENGIWESQTSTSGNHGFYVTRICEEGKTYVLWFPYYDIHVEFVMPSGKI